MDVPEALKGVDWRGRILVDATNAHVDSKPDLSLAGIARSRTALKARTSSEMVAEMAKHDGRTSAAVLTIVRSQQFRMIRGADYEE